MVAPRELEHVRRQHDCERTQRREPTHRTEPCSSRVPEANPGTDPGEEREGEQRTWRVTDAQLVPAQEGRERVDDGWGATAPASGRGGRVELAEGPSGLELPASDRHITAGIGAVPAERLQEVDGDAMQQVEGLLLKTRREKSRTTLLSV